MRKGSIKKGLIWTVLILIAVSFAADAAAWYLSPASYEAKPYRTMDAGEALCSGCNIEDGLYIPKGSYGQLNFSADVKRAAVFTVTFSEGLSKDMNLRFYYGKDRSELTRDHMLEYTFPKGTTSAVFTFPEGNWSEYRLDFYGNAVLKDLTIKRATKRIHYIPNALRILIVLAGCGLLSALVYYCRPIRRGLRCLNRNIIDPETRKIGIDIAYCVFALAMFATVIYTSLAYFSPYLGAARFVIPMLVFAAVTFLLGRMWKNPGAWMLGVLLLFIFLRIALFRVDDMGKSEQFLYLGVFAYFGCYGTAFAIRPRARKTFLMVFTALWTVTMVAISCVGIYVARTGANLGGFRMLTLAQGRLYIVRHPVTSGIMQSVAVAVALLGFALYKNKIVKVLFALAVLPILLAGILTATRTNYILTAFVFSAMICILIYDRLQPVKKGLGYHLPVWKWIVLAMFFFVMLAGVSLVQPYVIDGFNAVSGKSVLGVSRALAEGNSAPVMQIANRNFSNEGAINLTGRLDIWKSLFQAIEKDPKILLYGQTLDYDMESVNVFLRVNAGFNAYHCHNIYLQTLLESGIPGALLYIGFIIYFICHAYQLMTDKDQPFWKRMIPLPALACVIGDLVDITTHFRCGNPQMIILFLCAGLTIAMNQVRRKEKKAAGKAA